MKETNGLKTSITGTIFRAATVNPKSALWDRPTFHNVGRWAYGLANDVPGDYKSAHAGRRKAVLSCALINVKKTTGGRAATIEVEQHARRYSHFLRQQIEIIAPDVIVFGGTYQMVKDHVLPGLTKVAPRVHTYGKIICINANHPACTKPRVEMFKQVVDRYRSYLAQHDARICRSNQAVSGSPE